MNRILLFVLLVALGCDRVDPVGVDVEGAAQRSANQADDISESTGVDVVGELDIPILLERVEPPSSKEIVIRTQNGIVITPDVLYGQKIETRLEGKVVKVTAADAIVILVDNQQLKVRLTGIDAPECEDQPFGTAAKDALAKMVNGRAASVLVTGKDRAGQTLGFVLMPIDTFAAEVNLNDWLLEMGWAWHDDNQSDSEKLAELENKAREANAGLWAGRTDLDRIPPWRWRQGLRSWKKLQAGNAGH